MLKFNFNRTDCEPFTRQIDNAIQLFRDWYGEPKEIELNTIHLHYEDVLKFEEDDTDGFYQTYKGIRIKNNSDFKNYKIIVR
jgi:hypothetical protein